MLLKYLITNRERINICSKNGLITIAKRALSFFKLQGMIIREIKLVMAGASIGDLVVIEPLCIQGPKSNISIGSGTFIGAGVFIAAHDTVSIGNNVVINSGVEVFTASHDVDSPEWPTTTAPIILEDFVWVASGAIILPGTRLCRGAVVGAGAVVSGVIKEGTVVAGNPAKQIKSRATSTFAYSPSMRSAVIQAWLGKS